MRTITLFLVALAVLGSGGCSKREPAAPAAKPVVVFNSFGPDGSYDKSVGWGVGIGAKGYRGQAEFFVPETGGRLDSITLATEQRGGTGGVNFAICDDFKGVPGVALESFLNVSNPVRSKTSFPVVRLLSTNKPVLKAGTKYWISAEPANEATSCMWYYNNRNLTNGFAFERAPWTWEFFNHAPPKSGVFSVSVVTVQPGANPNVEK